MALRYVGNTYYLDELARVSLVRSGRGSRPHTHDFVEITYIKKGKCVHMVDDKAYPVKRGDMLVINYGQKHSIISDEKTDYINILLKPEAVSESVYDTENAFSLLALENFQDFQRKVDQNNRCVCFEGTDRARVELLLDWLCQEYSHPADGAELMRRSQLNMLLILLFRKMAIPMGYGFMEIDERMLQYLRQNCSRRLTVKEISAQCGYNPDYFSRLFRKFCGMTFTQYLTECRMDKACHLLQESDLTVDAVIGECGYTDRTKFFQHFCAKTGVTPLKYRKGKN